MTDFRRPDRDPDLEVEISLFQPEQGGLRHPLRSGIRISHDFGLPGEFNDGMYELPHDGALDPGETGRAFVWFLSPDRNTGRFSRGFEFRMWNGGWVGKGGILYVLNDHLKSSAPQGGQPGVLLHEPVEVIYSHDRQRRIVIFAAHQIHTVTGKSVISRMR